MLPRMIFFRAVLDIKRLSKQLQQRHTIRKTLTIDADTHTYTVCTYIQFTDTHAYTDALTNPNQSLGNVLSAMQGNNMSFTTI